MTTFRELGWLLLLAIGIRCALCYLAARYDARLEAMAREASEPGWDGGHVMIVTPLYDWSEE